MPINKLIKLLKGIKVDIRKHDYKLLQYTINVNKRGIKLLLDNSKYGAKAINECLHYDSINHIASVGTADVDLELFKLLLHNDNYDEIAIDQILCYHSTMDRLDIVEEILKYGKYSIGALDSAVYYAAEKENVEILQLLLKTEKCTVNGINEVFSGLPWLNLDVVKPLLKTEKYTEENIYCVFRMSVFYSIEVMKYLLKKSYINDKDIVAVSLVEAAQNDRVDAVKVLIAMENLSGREYIFLAVNQALFYKNYRVIREVLRDIKEPDIFIEELSNKQTFIKLRINDTQLKTQYQNQLLKAGNRKLIKLILKECYFEKQVVKVD